MYDIEHDEPGVADVEMEEAAETNGMPDIIPELGELGAGALQHADDVQGIAVYSYRLADDFWIRIEVPFPEFARQHCHQFGSRFVVVQFEKRSHVANAAGV